MSNFISDKIILPLSIILIMNGCSHIDKAFNEYENITRVEEITSPENLDQTIIKRGKNKFLIDIGGSNFKTLYESANLCTSDSPAKEKLSCRNSRNKIISQWMYVSDRACAYHLGAILGRANTTNVFLGLASITTSGLATFLGGQGTKQALAAASTITNSANTLIKSEIYLGSLTPLLTKKIEDHRNAIGDNINGNLNSETTDFPIDQAVSSLSKYHEACSFRMGVQLLGEALEQNGPTKQEIDNQIKQLQARKSTLIEEVKKYKVPDQQSPLRGFYDNLIQSAQTEINYIDRRSQELLGSRPSARRAIE